MTPAGALIEQLVRDGTPVRRLPPPLRRTAAWLLLSAGATCAAIGVTGFCPDLPARLTEPFWLAGLLAAGATGILAGTAAFHLSLPDRSRLWVLLPLPALLIWLGAITLQCLAYAARVETRPANALFCAGAFAVIGAILAGSLFRMLRRAPLGGQPETRLLSGLAVAGLATAAFSLTRTFDSSAFVLAWNLGAGFLTAVLLARPWRGFVLVR